MLFAVGQAWHGPLLQAADPSYSTSVGRFGSDVVLQVHFTPGTLVVHTLSESLVMVREQRRGLQFTKTERAFGSSIAFLSFCTAL